MNEVQIAQSKLSEGRERAKHLGDEARHQFMIYLATKKRWLAAVDEIERLDKDMDEKIEIQRAMDKRAAERRKHEKLEDGDMV